MQPVAGLRRDLSSPGLRAGGDGEDLRHFSARGRGGARGEARPSAAGPGAPRSGGPGRGGGGGRGKNRGSPRRCVPGRPRRAFAGWKKIKRDAKARESGWGNSEFLRAGLKIIIPTTPAGRRGGGPPPAGEAGGGRARDGVPGAVRGGAPPPPVPPSQPFPCVYYRGGLGAATGARKSAAGSRGAGPRPHAIPGASGAESRATPAPPPPQPPSGSPKKPRAGRGREAAFFFFFVRCVFLCLYTICFLTPPP